MYWKWQVMKVRMSNWKLEWVGKSFDKKEDKGFQQKSHVWMSNWKQKLELESPKSCLRTYMAKIWQKMKKSLVQLAFNPFLHGSTVGTHNSGFEYPFCHYIPLPPPDCVRPCSMIVHWPRRPRSLPSPQKWQRPLSSIVSVAVAASICCFCGHCTRRGVRLLDMRRSLGSPLAISNKPSSKGALLPSWL